MRAWNARVDGAWRQGATRTPSPGRFRRDRLGQGEHVGLAGIVGGLVGPRREAAERGQLRMPPRPRTRMPGRKWRVSCVSARTLRSISRTTSSGAWPMERAGEAHAGAVDEHVGVGAGCAARAASMVAMAPGAVTSAATATASTLKSARMRPPPPSAAPAAARPAQVVAGRREPARQGIADALRAAGHHRHRPQARIGRQRRGSGRHQRRRQSWRRDCIALSWPIAPINPSWTDRRPSPRSALC